MRNNKGFIFLFSLIVFSLIIHAQDKLPLRLKNEKPVSTPKQAKERGSKLPKIIAPDSMPALFEGTAENRIDSIQWLTGILGRMAALAGGSEDTLRILHIGDSHVRGHIYPRTTGEKLTKTFGALIYEDLGVNGATCLTFTHPGRIAEIAAFKPDLLILSFGTNESHGRGYNPQVHYRQIGELAGLLRDSLPGIPILLTTPPGSYESFRRKRKKRTYAVNPRTETASEIIKKYARENHMAVWDLYGIAGGKKNACTNWQRAGMMRPDHVHYIPEGYRLQGTLLFEALIKAYNESVTD